MKKIFLSISISLISILSSYGQDTNCFQRTIYNSDNSIYLRLNLVDRDVEVPGQGFMGALSGYLGDEQDSRKWLVIDSEITSETTALLTIVNEECSEDLVATLTYNPEKQTYLLTQGEGSTLKIARNRKWQKLPKKLEFTVTKQQKKQ